MPIPSTDPIRQLRNLIHTHYAGTDPAKANIDFLYRQPTSESMKPAYSFLRPVGRVSREDTYPSSEPLKPVRDDVEVLIAVPKTKNMQDEDALDQRWVMFTQLREILQRHGTDMDVARAYLSGSTFEDFVKNHPNEARVTCRIICEYEYC